MRNFLYRLFIAYKFFLFSLKWQWQDFDSTFLVLKNLFDLQLDFFNNRHKIISPCVNEKYKIKEKAQILNELRVCSLLLGRILNHPFHDSLKEHNREEECYYNDYLNSVRKNESKDVIEKKKKLWLFKIRFIDKIKKNDIETLFKLISRKHEKWWD